MADEGRPDGVTSEHATDQLAAELSKAVAEGAFSGVVLVHDNDRQVLELASGMANRAEAVPMTIETKLATASGTKGFTALAITSMIEDGMLDFDSRLVEVVGGDLSNIDPAVTIEHLLGHTSGVGDYLDEELLDDPDDYVLDVPVHQLLGPEDFVPILNRYQQKEPPGTRFAYNNGGYMWLALVIERVAGNSYHDEVRPPGLRARRSGRHRLPSQRPPSGRDRARLSRRWADQRLPPARHRHRRWWGLYDGA